jgi:hypothetical protein
MIKPPSTKTHWPLPRSFVGILNVAPATNFLTPVEIFMPQKCTTPAGWQTDFLSHGPLGKPGGSRFHPLHPTATTETSSFK